MVTDLVQGALDVTVAVWNNISKVIIKLNKNIIKGILTSTSGIIKVAILASVAVLSGIITLALAHSRVLSTHVIHRSDFIALTGLALGVVEEPVGALFTKVSGKVVLATALAILRLTLISISTLQVTVAGFAVRESVITISTVIAVGLQVLLPALALTSLLGTVSGQVKAIAVALLAHVRLVPVAALRTIVLGRTFVTVDAHRVVLTVLADTTTLVVAVDVQRGAIAVHLLVVLALARVAMAVAG